LEVSVVPWFFAVAESDHPIQNPTSAGKLLRLGQHLRLTSESRVLDLACGRGGPAVILAESFGCRVLGVERAPEFVAAARERVTAAGLDDLVEIVEADAGAYVFEDAPVDAALCLGATFIWGGFPETLDALMPAVRTGGYVVVGEPFWKQWPLPGGVDDLGFTDLPGITSAVQAAGLRLVGVIASSTDDWDVYESLRWRALEEWLDQHSADPDADEIAARHKAAQHDYLAHERGRLGWAIVIGWKAGGA
jgi:SAM-dependent methyltransferase